MLIQILGAFPVSLIILARAPRLHRLEVQAAHHVHQVHQAHQEATVPAQPLQHAEAVAMILAQFLRYLYHQQPWHDETIISATLIQKCPTKSLASARESRLYF